MVRKLGQGNRINYAYSQWICDNVADIATIPRCPMGSTVYVIHTGDTYVLDSTGKWCCPGSGNPPIECPDDFVEESTIWEDIPST